MAKEDETFELYEKINEIEKKYESNSSSGLNRLEDMKRDKDMSDLISRKEVIEMLCAYHIDNIAFNGKRITEMIKEIQEVKAFPASEIVEEIIGTIEKEIDESPNTSRYICEDGTNISTDVDYVYDWFEKYKDVLRKKYC